MSNRTDFGTLADELREQFLLSRRARMRIETELHNAFIAGQEEAERSRDLLEAAPAATAGFGDAMAERTQIEQEKRK